MKEEDKLLKPDYITVFTDRFIINTANINSSSSNGGIDMKRTNLSFVRYNECETYVIGSYGNIQDNIINVHILSEFVIVLNTQGEQKRQKNNDHVHTQKSRDSNRLLPLQ